MYILDQEKARKILLSQNKNLVQINLLLKNYPPINDDLGKIIDHWFVDQTIPDLVIDNIALKDVIEKRHSHFLVAIRDLNILLDPSLSPEKREQWHRILSTPQYYE